MANSRHTVTGKDGTAVRKEPAVMLNTEQCARCGGLLVGEQCTDLLDTNGQMDFPALRCLQCGDVVDMVILHNRRQGRTMGNTYQRPTKWDTHCRGTSSVQ